MHDFFALLKKIDIYKNSSIIFFIFLSSFIVFGHSLTFGFFIFDDYTHILGNYNFDQSSFLKIFKHLERPFIPLTYLIWGVISYFFGKDNAFYFHLLNLVFHSLNAFLVFIWIKEFFRVLNVSIDEKKIIIASFVGAMLFLLHPLKVESVVWISGFKDILSFNLAILSFILFLKSKNNILYLFYSLGMLGLAGFAKPNVVILILFFFLFDFFHFKMNKKRGMLYLGMFLAFSLFVFFYYKGSLEFGNFLVMPNFFATVSMASSVIVFYIIKFIWPVSLSFDYGLHFEALKPDIKIYLSVLFVLAISLFVLWRFKNNKKNDTISISIILFFILLLPVLGFMPFLFQNISTVADRFMYFPSLAISFLCATLYLAFFEKKDNRRSMAVFYIFLLACLSITQSFKWKTDERILTHSFNINKDSYPLAMALATIAEKEKKLDRALDYYRKANRIKPSDMHSYGKILKL
ncbi:MAG: hypothetical protein OXB84_01660, partial [Halobacteriovoraceae bacterium]|nr:hypothetical protein [Halobacteriovoraceae bacterium]